MKEKSLVSRCTIKDFMVSNNLKAHQVEITIEMINANRSASLKYKPYLGENRKLQAKEKEDNVIILLDQEISGLEEKKKFLSEVYKSYNEEFVTFTKAAGEQTDMSGYVTNETPTFKRKRS